MGRPRKYTTKQNRTKSVALSSKANFLLENVKKQRINFDFSRYISECIERDFSDNISWIKQEISEYQKIADDCYRKMNKLAEEIKILRDKKVKVDFDGNV